MSFDDMKSPPDINKFQGNAEILFCETELLGSYGTVTHAHEYRKGHLGDFATRFRGHIHATLPGFARISRYLWVVAVTIPTTSSLLFPKQAHVHEKVD